MDIKKRWNTFASCSRAEADPDRAPRGHGLDWAEAIGQVKPAGDMGGVVTRPDGLGLRARADIEPRWKACAATGP